MQRDLLGFKQMITRNTATCLLCLFILFGVDSIWADVPAFPGAEGYGKNATGGRGGAVYEVTNLNSSGPGSFAAAVAASGPRAVVFRVGGTIDADISINNDDITIAGQTAPGDGICLKGSLSIGADNVIIRYIRVRDEVSGDAIGGRYHRDIILDHVSASWSSDEVMSIYHCNYYTIQWCMITEACSSDHRFAGIWGGDYSTHHHNLIAHCESRNPRWASGCGNVDYRNNVIYNWGYNSCYGGEAQQPGNPEFNFSNINMIANYYKYGPGTESGVRSRIADPWTRDGCDDAGKWWVGDNYVWGYPDVTADNWLGFTKASESCFRLSAPWPAMAINQQTTEDAYNAVLDHAGCSYPNRDAVDARIIEEVRTGTATYGDNGHIGNPSEVGGWPTLATGTPPADSDHDGMPNDWETAKELNPTDATDRNDYTLSTDYTNLEVYLDSLVNTEDTTIPTPDPMTWATAPYGANPTSITMVATTATDASGVEYFFDCTAGGGHDSGWQDSTVYTDTGLTFGVTYSYKVKAHDKSTNHNETGYSAVESATPIADTTAPTPNPMTWATPPAATGIDTITMTATEASDASGVQYYFANDTDPNHDSGWQDGTVYTDTGLTNNTTYSYHVMASDKSPAQNETDWSAEANATTIRYICTEPLDTDFNGDCKVDFMDYATLASGWGADSGMVVELVTNGDFATDLSGWTLTPSAPTTITWDNGTALLARNDTTATANGNYLYQIIPVVSGKQYKVDAEWKGDLLNGGTGRNWAEVFVGFGPDATTFSGSIMYKKATDGGPNAEPMPWDWESVLLSPNDTSSPVDGIFTATNSYMTIAFNLGGRADVGPGYYNVDNISVVEAGGPPCPANDLNDDCALDWLDIEVFVADWLTCNRDPATECWQ